jgi:hypothetical protein
VRFDFLEGGRQGVKTASQLVQLSGLGPARQLPTNSRRIQGAGQEQPGFKNRLIAHDFQETSEFHVDNLSQMAYYCNEIAKKVR